MAHDSCSYSQRENKDCGRYPTCRKSGAAGSSPGRTIIFHNDILEAGCDTGCLIADIDSEKFMVLNSKFLIELEELEGQLY